MGEYILIGKKRGIVLVSLLILSIFLFSGFVFALSASDCNPSNTLYCKGLSSCVGGTETDTSGSINCEIDVDQTIYLSKHLYFNFNTLNVKKGVTLRFLSSSNIAFPTQVSDFNNMELVANAGGAGSVEPPETGCAPADGRWGGAGGQGGSTLVSGNSGNQGTCGCYAADKGYAQKPGAYVTIKTNKLLLNGSISVDGQNGGEGAPAVHDCTNGCPGGGGAGGSGGGVIVILANTASGIGNITASGGNGGSGGLPTDDCGDTCGDCGDDGGGGGHGGGGGAGFVLVSPQIISAGIQSFMNKGFGGYWHCNSDGSWCDIAINGYTSIKNCYCQGTPAAKDGNESPLVLSPDELDCNNHLDDDNDGFIDMADSDCFLNIDSTGWNNKGPISPSVFTSPTRKPGITLSVGKNSYPSWNPSALNGSDAVCGDDFSCTPKHTVVDCHIISDSTTCSDNGCTWTNAVSESCSNDISCNSFNNYGSGCDSSAPDFCRTDNYDPTHVTCEGGLDCTTLSPADCRLRIPDGCEYTPPTGGECVSNSVASTCAYATAAECVTDPECKLSFNAFSGDYGFITNPYLCYNNRSDLRASSANKAEQWSWLNARIGQNAFKIFTLKNDAPNKTTDIISNGAGWFYCNANNAITTGLAGTSIAEGGTFTDVTGSTNKISCVQAFELFYPGNKFQDGDCGTLSNGYCCDKDSSGNTAIFEVSRLTEDCECYYKPDIALLNPCTKYPSLCNGDAAINTSAPAAPADDIDKLFCGFDMTGCLNGKVFDMRKACNQIYPSNKGCNDANETCNNGVIVNSSTSASCCYGPNARCVKKPTTPLDNADCTAQGGAIYNPADSTCQSSQTITSGGYCCFTIPIPKQGFGKFNTLSPEVFTCFKQSDNNNIGQCCFDKSSCKNSDLVTLSQVVLNSHNRVFSQGSATHTIMNFDVISPSGLFADYVKRKTLDAGSTARITIGEATSRFFFADYSYLEFDMAYNTPDIELAVNGYALGGPAQYATNGNGSMRWHHFVVDLQTLRTRYPALRTAYFKDITITYPSGVSQAQVLIDNIVMTPESLDYIHNSPTQYCTGGFGTWIDDMDPPGAVNTNIWEEYGPYKFVCESQGSFGWTGKQCCGDDTRPGKYGEFFADTAGACFNGSFVPDGEAVWYARNDKTYYPDILHSEGEFWGCMIPDGKYNLRVSINGTTLGGPLITHNMQENCVIKGKYFCSEGEWKRIDRNIQGSGTITTKYAPVGAELITNGGFN